MATINNCTNGTILQYKRVEVNGAGATAATIPVDTSIPQITEGYEIISLNFTPFSATSSLLLQFFIGISEGSTAGGNTPFDVVIALFRDTSTDAKQSRIIPARIMAIGGIPLPVPSLSDTVPSGSTAQTTFSVRIGKDSTAAAKYVTVWNAQGASTGTGIGPELFGGTLIGSLSVTETQTNQ